MRKAAADWLTLFNMELVGWGGPRKAEGLTWESHAWHATAEVVRVGLTRQPLSGCLAPTHPTKTSFL
jgi:hypothetical protein